MKVTQWISFKDKVNFVFQQSQLRQMYLPRPKILQIAEKKTYKSWRKWLKCHKQTDVSAKWVAVSNRSRLTLWAPWKTCKKFYHGGSGSEGTTLSYSTVAHQSETYSVKNGYPQPADSVHSQYVPLLLLNCPLTCLHAAKEPALWQWVGISLVTLHLSAHPLTACRDDCILWRVTA